MKKSGSFAAAAAVGTLSAILLYVGLQFFLAWLAIRSIVPEDRLAVAQAAACTLCVFLGAVYSARRTNIGSLRASMLVALGFAAILLLVGLAVFKNIAWAGQGGGLLLAAAAGGIFAGLFCSRPQGKRKSRQVRKTKIGKIKQK